MIEVTNREQLFAFYCMYICALHPLSIQQRVDAMCCWYCRIVHVHLVLSTFHKSEMHPAHFATPMLASQTVHDLRMAVKEHLGGSVQSVALFSGLPCEEKNFMKPHHCFLSADVCSLVLLSTAQHAAPSIVISEARPDREEGLIRPD